MAHSYIFIDTQNEERSFKATDSLIYVYLFFLLQSLEKYPNNSPKILRTNFSLKYEKQLTGKYYSMVDIGIDEVYKSQDQTVWYLKELQILENRLKEFGSEISPVYLNQASQLKQSYSKPIPLKKLNGLINNVKWVLRVPGITPDIFHFTVTHRIYSKKTQQWDEIKYK